MKAGDKVKPKIGPFRDRVCTVVKVEFGRGAASGWVTVTLPNGSTGLFAGNELVSC